MDELIAALKANDRDAVTRLLATDPALARAERDGVSAVLWAMYYGKPDIALLLAKQKGELTLFEAAALGDAHRVGAALDADPSILDAFSPDGFQALGLAAFFGHAALVDLLVARGAQTSTASRNEMGVTPLQSAIAAGHTRIARALVEAGAAVGVKQRHGWTPLHAAAEHEDREIVELLLDRGADPTVRNAAGTSAADLARSKGNDALARYIEERVRH